MPERNNGGALRASMNRARKLMDVYRCLRIVPESVIVVSEIVIIGIIKLLGGEKYSFSTFLKLIFIF